MIFGGQGITQGAFGAVLWAAFAVGILIGIVALFRRE